jgi:hypothetical protein
MSADIVNYVAALRELENLANRMAGLAAMCQWHLREQDCDPTTRFYRQRHRALLLRVRRLDKSLGKEVQS